jgi:CelD/BcsL family acetyltransferase involved in cellulose biosynthesis
MTATVVEREPLRPLLSEWDELAERVATTPFAHPEWILAWCEAFAPRLQLETVTVRRAGRLAALVPLVRARSGVRAPANWHTPQFELLAEDGDARAELCERLLAGRPWSAALRFVSPDAAGALAAAATHAGYLVLRRSLTRSPVIDLRGRLWEEYASTVRSDHRSDIRRRWRRLREQGEVEVELADGSERLETLLGEGLSLEAASWKGRAGTAILSHPQTERFYRRVTQWAAERGWLRLTFVRLDGRPVAFSLDLEHRNVHHNLKNAYDETQHHCSPGKLLTGLLVERAFARGLQGYEFNGAPERYKLAWATGTADRQLVQAFQPSPPGLAQWLAYAVGRPAVKRALALRR